MKILVCCGFIVLLLGCSKSTEPGTVPPFSRFPLAAGNVWSYQGEESISNFRPIVSGATFHDTTVRWAAKVEVVGEQVLRDSARTWQFHLSDDRQRAFSSDTSQPIANEDRFYLLQADTLFYYAYTGSSSAPTPKMHSNFNHMLRENVFEPFQGMLNPGADFLVSDAAVSTDPITYLLNPAKALVFPLRIGSEWNYSGVGLTSLHEGKKVVGTETITTDAGIFYTMKVQWLLDLSDTGTWDTSLVFYDYFSAQGLIKREISRSIIISTVQYPEGIGSSDFKDTYVLKSMILR